jgi:glucokinase
MRSPVLAVDLGGTRMRAAVVDSGGRVLERRIQPTPRDAECPEALIALIGHVPRRAAVAEAVVGVPGRVDYGQGRLESAPNLPPGWAPEIAEEKLADVLGLSVALANDADLAAVGESRFGAGRGYADIVYLTVSTGIGAGAVLGGLVVHGRRSLAELGHTVIDRAAALRGDPSTLEDLASGTALGRAAAAAGLHIDGPGLEALVRADDPRARRIWDAVSETVGIGVANLAHLFSPEVVIVGGGVSRAGELLLEPIRSCLSRFGPRGLPKPIEVVLAALGDDAGLVGAAAWSEAFIPEAASRV